MFNLGFPEMVLVGMTGLLLFGPKRLPELAKSLGKGIRDFKKALSSDEEEVSKLPKSAPENTVATGADLKNQPTEA